MNIFFLALQTPNVCEKAYHNKWVLRGHCKKMLYSYCTERYLPFWAEVKSLSSHIPPVCTELSICRGKPMRKFMKLFSIRIICTILASIHLNTCDINKYTHTLNIMQTRVQLYTPAHPHLTLSRWSEQAGPG